MANSKKGVQYTFEGQYYTGSDVKSEQVKTYSLDIVFPQVEQKALSYFKTGLKRHDGIYKLMIKKYPDFTRVRTMVITNVKNLSGSADSDGLSIATMNKKQLAKYIEKKGLGIDAEVYSDDITRLRNAIIQAEENPEAFKETYAADVEAYKFSKGISELNDVSGNDESEKEADDSDDSAADDLADELLNGNDESEKEA